MLWKEFYIKCNMIIFIWPFRDTATSMDKQQVDLVTIIYEIIQVVEHVKLMLNIWGTYETLLWVRWIRC